MAKASDSVKKTPMWFLDQLDIYKTVKPYRLDFDPDDDEFPRTNVQRREVPDVPIRDLRDFEDKLDFSQCGFTVLRIPEAETQLNFDDFDFVQQHYYPSMENAVQDFSQTLHPGAKAIALDHKVRKRHRQFPLSTGVNYYESQPVLVAHAGKLDTPDDSLEACTPHEPQ